MYKKSNINIDTFDRSILTEEYIQSWKDTHIDNYFGLVFVDWDNFLKDTHMNTYPSWTTLDYHTEWKSIDMNKCDYSRTVDQYT